MSVDVTRVFRRDKIADQLLGLAFGIGVAVLTVVVSEVMSATDDELLSGAFWLTIVSTAIRSSVSALGTVLGMNIPGVSSGD